MYFLDLCVSKVLGRKISRSDLVFTPVWFSLTSLFSAPCTKDMEANGTFGGISSSWGQRVPYKLKILINVIGDKVLCDYQGRTHCPAWVFRKEKKYMTHSCPIIS